MPTPQRLPIVNSDDGTWGDILRQYLMKEHYDDGNPAGNAANGGHQTITVRAGTASAGTAPLKFTSGTLLTTAEAGAIEFNNDKLYFTKTTGPTRQAVATYDATGSTGDIYYRDSGGSFLRLPVGNAGDMLTVSSGIPAWSAAIPNTATVTVKDTNFTLQDDGDTSKQAKFQLSGITAGQTRTYTVPDANTTLLGTNIITTKGDLYVGTGASAVTRLESGASGNILSVNTHTTTGLAWTNPVDASGPLNFSSGVAPRNGTSSHTINFGFTSTSGNLLVVFVAGAVTHTASGWTEREQPVASSELSLFEKTSTGESSITVTHNSSDYPVNWAVYEFLAGSTYTGSVSNTQSGSALSTLSGLPGTKQYIIAAWCASQYMAPNTTGAAGWLAPWEKDVDSIVNKNGSTDGDVLTVAHYSGFTGTSINPSSSFTSGYSGSMSTDRQNIVVAYNLPDGSGLGLLTRDNTAPVSNKTLDNSNKITVQDTNLTLQDDGDITKQAKFQLSGITTATTRTYTLPDADGTLAVDSGLVHSTGNESIAGTKTFTNKPVVKHIEIQPASLGGSASLFLNNNNGQTWEFFGNNGGSFGVYDQSNSKQPFTIDPNASNDTLKLSPGGLAVGAQLDMLSHKIVNVTDPTNPQEAATKAYVDSRASAVQTLTNKTLTTPVLDGTPTGTGIATTATASTLALRDANANLIANAHFNSFTTTATAAGTTTLTIASTQTQEFTGSTTQTVLLPTTSVPAGAQYTILNNSSGVVTVQSSGGNTVSTMSGNTTATFTAVVNTPTTAAGWDSTYIGNAGDMTKAVYDTANISEQVVGVAATQNLTNKTLTNPTVSNYTESVVAKGTVTTSSTLNLTSGTVQTATLTASTACTFTMPTATAGKSFVLLLKQAATTGNGSATFTGVKWSSGGAPTITATAGKMDILSFFADGASWYGSYTQGYTP